MKKILLTLTLLFAFSFSAFGQKLIEKKSYKDLNIETEEYDNEFRLSSEDFGVITINNSQIVILSYGINKSDNSYLLISLNKDNIYAMVNQLYFREVLEYRIFNENKKEYIYQQKLNSQTISKENIVFNISKSHFNSFLDTNNSMFIVSKQNVNAYQISILINMLKVAEDKIRHYTLYQKYLK